MRDNITGMCVNECLDAKRCSQTAAPCTFRTIRTEADLAGLAGCTELCGLELRNLPPLDPRAFDSLLNITRIRGHLTIVDNAFLYSLSFFKNLVTVCD